MIDLPNYSEQDLQKAQQYLNQAADFYGFESFDAFMKSTPTTEAEKRIVRLAELLQKTTHVAHLQFTERICLEMAYFHRTMRALSWLLLFFITVSAALVAYVLWVV